MRFLILPIALFAVGALYWWLPIAPFTVAADGTDTAAAAAAAGREPDFWGHWGDGKSEISSYALEYPRYGSPREGVAVTIFVNEQLSEKARVKHEDPSRGEEDILPVMKLNWIQDFPTGIYDYSLMTTVFALLEERGGIPAGALKKVSFSAQEWCGHIYSQLLFSPGRTELSSHSYFDGEGDVEASLDLPAGGLSEDALLLWARGFAGARPAPGASIEVPLLRSLEKSRLLHVDLGWQTATATREEQPREVRVPAGSFVVDRYTLSVPAARVERSWPVGAPTMELPASIWTVDVEGRFPHRIVQRSRDDGLRARLLGSDRIPYWERKGPAGISELGKIGLRPRPPRTP